MPERKHYVVFYSPGTFVSETTSRPIEAWDVAAAVRLSRDIIERHQARPYGFRFETRLVAEPVDDGEGGVLQVTPKLVEESGTYFLGGHLLTYHEVEARNEEGERILRSNMRSSDWCIVVVNDNSWRSMIPFGEQDVLLCGHQVAASGDDPEHVAYRRRVQDELNAEYEAQQG